MTEKLLIEQTTFEKFQMKEDLFSQSQSDLCQIFIYFTIVHTHKYCLGAISFFLHIQPKIIICTCSITTINFDT